MGLRTALITITLLAATSCATQKDARNPVPAKRETYRVDCCDPGIDADTKFVCKWAIKNPSHIFVDARGKLFETVWSECKPGEEPWRKYE